MMMRERGREAEFALAEARRKIDALYDITVELLGSGDGSGCGLRACTHKN